ncbi:MAG: diguanylate cyclase, partial [Sphingomonas bacterium]|nr:diguanylate cyclase [Sphingomonas bacterium]
MSNRPSSQFAQPRIDARALLGLYDPADSTDWAPIRAAQLNAGSQLALFMLGANVIGAALVALIVDHLVPHWAVASWGATVAAVAATVTLRRLASRERTAQTATLKDVRDTVLEGLALGAVWSIPPLAIGLHADAGIALGLWIVLSLLLTASAVAMAALPLATLSFIFVLGASVTAMLFVVGGPLLAAAAALFATLLMIACYGRGKALVVIRASEISLAERDETVSLLLREFQDQNGDWLWETDANRRVIRASPRFA